MQPLVVYGLDPSYYTGKLEGYLRYKEIPYRRVELSSRTFTKTVLRNTGLLKMPAVELPDGRWLTDTTPIIEWLETAHPEPAVIPSDPVQAITSRLVEDYADEWLWRPAMHYRWSYDGELMSGRLADEILRDVPAPRFLRRRFIRRRQYRWFVPGDGVTPETRAHVERIYTDNLAWLEAVLAGRPFLLGERPTLADFGYFASMFRHFGIDPTPARIMRDTAPGVYAWVARVWNARASRVGHGALAPAGTLPESWGPILSDVGAVYLPYLGANAAAYARGEDRFETTIQGVQYRRLPTSQYRVWCLEELRRHVQALPDEARARVQAVLERHGAWAPLWATGDLDSGWDPDGLAPFARPRPLDRPTQRRAAKFGTMWGRPGSRSALGPP
jgi:glutathione S-transferase